MALLNPVYAFVVPFLFLITVPLAVFAGITTTIAFSALILRVLAVYLDVGLSLIPQYLGQRKAHYHHAHRHQYQYHANGPSLAQQVGGAVDAAPGPSSISPSSSTASSHTSLRRRRHRRSSSALSASASVGLLPTAPGSVTPGSIDGPSGLAPSIGPERDFEGVGGWRLGDDDAWTTLYSRLELPDRQHHGGYHIAMNSGNNNVHQRSPSRPTTPGESGILMMKMGRATSPETNKRCSTSPNSSRTRTPSGSRVAFDSYFPPLTASPKASKKPSPTALSEA